MSLDLPELARGLESLCGRFHAHLTLAEHEGLEDYARRERLKRTVIDLERGPRRQRDLMLTEHFLDGQPGAVLRILGRLEARRQDLEARGFELLRVKLEQETGVGLERFDERHYREVHVKLLLPVEGYEATLEALRGQAPWVLSTNPRERRTEGVVHFLNLRLYQGGPAEAEAAAAELVARLAPLPALEVRQETVVLDTHRAHDAWWA